MFGEHKIKFMLNVSTSRSPNSWLTPLKSTSKSTSTSEIFVWEHKIARACLQIKRSHLCRAKDAIYPRAERLSESASLVCPSSVTSALKSQLDDSSYDAMTSKSNIIGALKRAVRHPNTAEEDVSGE